jgi:hypothetical protein
MQIIAKAVLTFFGLSAFVNLSQNFRMIIPLLQTPDLFVLQAILLSLLVIILVIATVYWLILKNDWLVHKIAGPGENLDPESETFWLIGSLRMVALFYGLLLLSSSITKILNIIALPFYLCPPVSEIFTFGTFTKWDRLPYIIYDLFEALLAVYLLYGWPHFIRYQLSLRKSELSLAKKLNIEGTKNE